VSISRFIATMLILATASVANIAAKSPQKPKLSISESVVRQFEKQCVSGQKYNALVSRAEQSGWKNDVSDKRLVFYSQMMSAQDVDVVHATYKRDRLFLVISKSTHLNILKNADKSPMVLIGCEVFDLASEQQLELYVLKNHFGEPKSGHQDKDSVIYEWVRKSGTAEISVTSQFISPQTATSEPKLNLLPGIGLRAGYLETNKEN
jgi:hypothetical protein